MKKTTATKKWSAAVALGLALSLGLTACGGSASSASTAASSAATEASLQIGQTYAAAHGTDCFAEAVAVVQGNVIVAAYVDEFQFTAKGDDVVGVPNSDADFAAGYADGQVLISKRENTDYYSKLMKDYASATETIDGNFDAIQSYAVGKTIDELEQTAAQGEKAVDAVSGATLVDTAGYLSAIAQAAKAAQSTQAVQYSGSTSDLKLKVSYEAAHGTKCFTSAAALTDGKTIVLSYLDEFQFTDQSGDVTGVPNSDAGLAAGCADGQVLISKRENADYYSKLMKDYANATVSIDGNYDAIQSHVDGMSIADAKTLAQSDNAVDSVSGATLADTANYIAAIAAAAEK